MIITAVCKDAGGSNGMLPVVNALRAQGHEVDLIADESGAAVKILSGSGIAHRIVAHIEDVGDLSGSQAILTSMCSGGGIGRDLVRKYFGKITTIALQDFWGARLWTDWADVRPDYVVVNDVIGAALVQNAWPDQSPETIKVLGYPAFDKYATFDHASHAAEVISAIHLKEGMPLVLYSGQVAYAGEILQDLVDALNAIGRPACLVARAHPRMRSEAPEQETFWNEALARFSSGSVVFNPYALEMPSLIAASSVVVSGYSTTLVEAALLRKPNIAMLYPEKGMRSFRKEMAGHMDEFPLVSLGCSKKAENQAGLEAALAGALNGSLGLEEAQKVHLAADGCNAERVAQFINTLV